ncbi:secreted RxLR effector protein 161-like [Arachis hypogaea]|uniref:secreted RxLR effector protein 161-like n=1 Tax=Arachis hypogaea TaxID=3818 RepID=UPI003B226D7C
MCPSSEAERMEMSRVPYASAVGSLMYAMICTRPDIAQAIVVVSRFMVDPGKEHWNVVKRILRYIKGTSNVALCFGGSEFIVNGYVDSDFAGDLDKRKSTTGYVFMLAGGAVSWLSKLQTVVALSTTEAEYMAATQACKKAIWIQRLIEELGHKQQKIFVYCDMEGFGVINWTSKNKPSKSSTGFDYSLEYLEGEVSESTRACPGAFGKNASNIV